MDIAEFIRNTIEALGYFGVALLMYVEMVVPVVPSEVVMPFAGFTASSGDLSLMGIVIAGIVGSLLGALTLYLLARTIKEETIYRLAGRYGVWVGLTPGYVKRAAADFDKHCRSSVFAGRLIPGVRSAISLPAGIRKMPVYAYLLFTFFGVSLWSGGLAYMGFLFGENYEQISGIVGMASSATILVIGAVMVFVFVRGFMKHRKSTDR